MAKKISQTDLRRLMSLKKNDVLQIAKKIDSPLAKYKDGQLWCILCDTIVKSDSIWPIHINSKKHKENINKKKSAPPIYNDVKNAAASLKRQADSPLILPPPPKQIKSILKNPIAPKPPESNLKPGVVPDDFFDAPNTRPSLGHLNLPKSSNNEDVHTAMDIDVPNEKKEDEKNETPLPEGFFDDPIQDAKARNVEYKDPIEEEWEKFQKELKEESTVSAQIIAEDQEEAVTDRQIVEIDEQLRNWERVLELEVKKEKFVEKHVKKSETDDVRMGESDEEEDSLGEDEIEFLSWRAKKSFK